MSARPVASFEHYGIAPFEVEALFSILNGTFTVYERKVERRYEDNYACMIDINFPLEFNSNFFEVFGHKRWGNITFLIKEMRRRTGKKGVMLIMHFTGKPALSFTVAMREENLFEFALEKMEFLNELVSFHIDAEKLPTGTDSVHYQFDPISARWKPWIAKGNGTLFKYEGGEWVISNGL
ncbi:MAG: hypothetical protein QXU32_06325 [Nitrososphaerales archaeon]